MSYIENPKTAGSGIKCCIPQASPCPLGCSDCFFNSGRSYLEPLSENLPNIPTPEDNVVYRINDGNDSTIDIETVLRTAAAYKMKFYNTSLTYDIDRFDAPVVLTVNSGIRTDYEFHKCDSDNLMYVRFRANTWNFFLAKECIMHYAAKGVTTVMTFMAYENIESIPSEHRHFYERRNRTLNDYWCIRRDKFKEMMNMCYDGPYGTYVRSCTEEGRTTKCKDCGNCLRLYFKKIHGGEK